MEAMTIMSEEEIKDLVGCYHLGDNRFGIGSSTLQDLERMTYTWATAKAEAEKLQEYNMAYRLGRMAATRKMDRTDTDWLNAVLARIGWPKDAQTDRGE